MTFADLAGHDHIFLRGGVMHLKVLALAAWMSVMGVLIAGEEETRPATEGVIAESPIKADYQSLVGADLPIAGPFGNLDVMPRRSAILKGVDLPGQRVTLLLD